ncbi:TonB family protein [Corallococcus exiguus]|uniref:TonB family protein n=1 Tax=Corallococcus exiguus TaxID=83462 RepID=UPI0014722A5E|nr:TonB family protein [Corallococcus exiguus]NNB87313.1 TonB family protein [Corallococcus exiguus]NNB97164.1 TonB family protein [Corallococcus exiguus]NNC07133.1 TonB family protein [Corallococcus exiguus]
MSSNLNARAALIAASLLTGASALAQGQPSHPPSANEAAKPAPRLTKAPVLVKSVEAAYPPDAAAQGLTADVKLIITIAEDGTVSDARPAEPVGHGFDEAAIEAVRAFQFSPAEVDGVPAPVQVEYVYHFTLSAPAASPDAPAEEVEKPRATLTGQLISRGSRSRVAGATVRCGDDPEAPEALSDEEGRFSLQVEPGECAVRVVASNFQLYQTTETLKPGETTEIVFYLVPKGGAFETVVRSERPKKEVVRRTVSREEAQKTPGTFGDPIRVIQALPGVARAPFSSGDLLVRGSNPGQSATLMDGVRIPLLFHLLGGPSVVNAEFIDSLDFYPGGYGSQYGRAVGGVVDVATRKGASDTVHGSVKVDLLDAGFFLEAPITDGVSVAAAARRSYVDALLPLVLPKEEGSTLSVVPRYWDYQLRVDLGSRSKEAPVPGAGRSTGYIMAFGADDQLSIVSSGDGQSRDIELGTHTQFHRIKGDWTYRRGDFTSVFTPYVGLDKVSTELGSYQEDDSIYSAGARQTLSLELSSALTMRTGVDAYFEHVVVSALLPISGGTDYVPFPGAEPQTQLQRKAITLNGFDGGVFWEADLTWGAFTLTPGVRGNLQHVNGTDNLALDPRLWLRYAASERTALKGSAGLYSQHAETYQFIPLPYGNPRLGYQRAFQASLGVEQRLTDAVNVDVTGFFNRRFKNVVAPGQLLTQEGGGLLQERFSNDGIGKAMGVELMVKKDRLSPTDKWNGWLSYTFSHAEDGRAGPLPAVTGGSTANAEDQAYGLSPWDQTHILTLVAGYLLGNGWEVGGRFRYTTGRPTTPLQHSYDVFRGDGNRFEPTPGPYFSARSSSFHQLDMRVDKSWRFENWTLTTYLDVQNLYNRKNAEFDLDDYRYRGKYELPGIPLLPVVGVKGSF